MSVLLIAVDTSVRPYVFASLIGLAIIPVSVFGLQRARFVFPEKNLTILFLTFTTDP